MSGNTERGSAGLGWKKRRLTVAMRVLCTWGLEGEKKGKNQSLCVVIRKEDCASLMLAFKTSIPHPTTIRIAGTQRGVI